MKKIHLIFVFASIIAITGCQSGKKNDQQTKDEKIKKSEIKSEVEDVLYPLPLPFELTQMLSEIEATYIFGITNEPENAEKYFTENKQAINLGVYVSDLTYSATYNFNQEMFNTLEGIKTLVGSLDLSSVVNPQMIEQIEQSADNKKELVKVVTDIIYTVYNHFHKQDRESISYLMALGSWVEGMHITINISDNTFENIEIVEVIMKQEKSLNKIMELLGTKINDNMLITDLYPALEEIQETFELEEGVESLSKKQIVQLTAQIEALRTTIVE